MTVSAEDGVGAREPSYSVSSIAREPIGRRQAGQATWPWPHGLADRRAGTANDRALVQPL